MKSIRYVFTFEGGQKETFDILAKDQTMQAAWPLPHPLPDWTRLGYQQCPNCPLDTNKVKYCPLAARISSVVERFIDMVSFTEAVVEVVTAERVLKAKTSAQRGISSLLGLVMAVSGCPRTAFFRPMARFHLPFADDVETIYRVTSMYILGQYFRHMDGKPCDMSMEGLADLYREVEVVNEHIARRLKATVIMDSSVNAIVILDVFAKTVPFVIEDKLEEMKTLFEPYLAME